MSVSDGLASAVAQALVGAGHPLKIAELMADRTLAGDVTMTNQHRTVQKMDPSGSHRNVLLPAAEDGMLFWFFNAASDAHNLVIKDAPGTTTVVTINQNESAIVFCAGTTWKLFAVISIALS